MNSRIIIWLEVVLVLIPTTLGAAWLLLVTMSILSGEVFEPSIQDMLLWLVPVCTFFGITALWVMLIGIVKSRPTSRVVVYGYVAGVAVVVFTGATGFDPKFSSWWVFPVRLFLNLGLPYLLVGGHWLYLLRKNDFFAASEKRQV